MGAVKDTNSRPFNNLVKWKLCSGLDKVWELSKTQIPDLSITLNKMAISKFSLDVFGSQVPTSLFT